MQAKGSLTTFNFPGGGSASLLPVSYATVSINPLNAAFSK